MRNRSIASGLVVSLTAALLPALASAADMPVKAPILKAPPPVVDPWTGWYVGINGGYSWGNWHSDSLFAIFPAPGGGLGTVANPHVNGWLGGVQAGYNWRFNRDWIFGIEADGQLTGERARRTGAANSARIAEVGNDFNDIFTTTAIDHWKFPWFATLRARLGWLIEPATLLYGTGGLAVGEFKFDTSRTVTCQQFGPGSTGVIPQPTPCNPPPGSPALGTVALSDSTTRAGFAVGGGIEHKFSRNWSAKAEYLYLDFGRDTFFTGTGTATSIHLRDQIARIGINYAFDQAVVAKY
jgi:outer membrane immunogenic protein